MPKKNILVVEDEPTIAFILQGSLSDLGSGYDIHVALSGNEAIKFHEASPINLLITDYYLEDINAVDLVTKLRESSNDFKWILITAFGSEDIEGYAQELDVFCILNKPFPLTDLRRAVLQAAPAI